MSTGTQTDTSRNLERLRNIIAGEYLEDTGQGDNLAIALCSYFEGHLDAPEDDPQNEYGWGEWASGKYEAALTRIANAVQDHIDKELTAAQAALAKLERGEYVCTKCGLRKDAEFEKGDF